MSRKKTEIYQTFLAPLKGGGYPQFGKTPNFFRFFLMKASLRQNGHYFASLFPVNRSHL